MQNLETTTNHIHEVFEARTAARDRALSQSRTLIRHCSNAIRAIHRDENTSAQQHIAEASLLVEAVHSQLEEYPDLYYAGYTQDALKEFAEANLVYAIIKDETLPTPEELMLEYSTYLLGLAETVGELRRRCLDLLLKSNFTEAERILSVMDEIYALLVTMDYPDAITGGLRRMTDLVRGIVERTRGDLAISIRQEHLENSIQRLESRLDRNSP